MAKLTNRLSNKVCPPDMTIEEWQVALRREQALESDFEVVHLDSNRIWGDYLVSSQQGGRYKVAFRGVCSELNYCSCLDFRTNGLGTCKHLEAVTHKLQTEVEGYPWSGRSYNAPYSSLYVSYKGGRSIRMRIGSENSSEYQRFARKYFDDKGILKPDDYVKLPEIEAEGTRISSKFRVYEDVYDFAGEVLNLSHWRDRLETKYQNNKNTDDLVECVNRADELIYRLCYQSSGILCLSSEIAYQSLVLRLADEVYRNMLPGDSLLGYIILQDKSDAESWKRLIANSNLPSTLQVIEAQTFVQNAKYMQPTVGFVWVDDALCLKDWREPLSVALKGLTINHLYMRLTDISELGPIQLSSILQHISPYILGALYRFVQTYISQFPLSNDGSNVPVEIAPWLFFVDEWDDTGSISSLSYKSIDPLSHNPKVDALLRALREVLDDEEASSIFKDKIDELLR